MCKPANQMMPSTTNFESDFEPLPFEKPSVIAVDVDDDAEFDQMVNDVLGPMEPFPVFSFDNQFQQQQQQQQPQQFQQQQPACSSPVSSPLIDNLCGGSATNTEQSLWFTAAQKAAPTIIESTQSGQQSRSGSPTTLMDKPKRALSAYNIFFREERKRLLEMLPDRESRGQGKTPRNSHGKLGFREMAGLISKKWRAITPEEKAPFDALAKQDSQRYRKEMQEWKLASQNVVTTVNPSTIPAMTISFFQ